MAVKLLTGKIGCGKTTAAIEEYVNVVKENSGAFSENFCYFVVPEQFCVEVESKILDKAPGLVNSEVISFNRLIYRLLGEVYENLGKPVSASGKAMLLTDIAYKNNDKLVYFNDVFEKPAMIEKLLETLTELQKYNFNKEMLEALAGKSQGENNQAKLREIALFLDDYNKLFGKEVLDIQLCYDEIASLIEAGKTSVSNSYIWIDSFSGFTKNELTVLKAIAKAAKGLTVSMGYDKKLKYVMGTVNSTCEDIKKLFNENGIEYKTIDIGNEHSRFSEGSSLKYLAENYSEIKKKDAKKTKADGTIRLVSCDNIYSEVINAVFKINKLNEEGVDYSEIALVMPDLEEKSYIVEAIFNSYNIPYFLDKKSKISGHPAIRYINYFLRILTKERNVDDIIKLLKTGLYKNYKKEKIDEFENLVLKYGINTKEKFKKFSEILSAKEKSCRVIDLTDDICDLFFGDKGYIAKAKSCKTVRDVIELINDFAEKTYLFKTLENIAKDEGEAFSLVWNAFADVMNECGKILGDTKIIGYKKLINFVQKIFAGGVSSLKVGLIPMHEDAVQIGNIARSRYSNKKVIIVLGANEGMFPPDAKDSGFIGEQERQILKDSNVAIGYNSIEKVLLGEYNAYSVAFSASEKLIISYSLSEKGSELRPAGIVNKINNLFDIETEKFEAEKHILVKSDEIFDIGEEVSKAILKIEDSFETSISRIKDFVECPYKYLLANVLRVKEREELAVTNIDTGNLFHYILEKSVKASKDKDFAALTGSDWKNLVKESVEEYYSDTKGDIYKFRSNEKDKLLLDRIIDFAEYEGTVLSKKAADTGFKPVFEEFVFGKDSIENNPFKIDCDGFTAMISGKIDRIDVRETEDKQVQVALVDYKSGTKELGLSKKDEAQIAEDGILLQLLTYKSAIDSGISKEFAEKIGEAAFVCSLSYYMFGKKINNGESKKHTYAEVVDNEIKDSVTLNEKTQSKDLNDLAEKNNEIIKDAANKIAKGNFSGNIKDGEDACKYCSYRNICRKPDRKDQNED